MNSEEDITERLAGVTGFPCISLIIPTDDQRYRDEILIHEVDGLLTKMQLSEPCIRNVHDRLASALKDARGEGLSLGIYLTPEFSYHVSFPFRAGLKITIDKMFEKAELDHLAQIPAGVVQ